MFKKSRFVRKNMWYLAADVNDISKIRETNSAKTIVCFSNTLFGSAQVHFYYKGECFKTTRSSVDFSEWNHLMHIRSSPLGRNANALEASLFNKISKDFRKDLHKNQLETVAEVIRDDAVVGALVGDDEPDEDSTDSCVIS